MDERDIIEVTRGAETFSPVDYHSFSIGPLRMTTRVGALETPEQAYDRAFKYLEAMARKQYVERATNFANRMKEIHEVVGSIAVRKPR